MAHVLRAAPGWGPPNPGLRSSGRAPRTSGRRRRHPREPGGGARARRFVRVEKFPRAAAGPGRSSTQPPGRRSGAGRGGTRRPRAEPRQPRAAGGRARARALSVCCGAFPSLPSKSRSSCAFARTAGLHPGVQGSGRPRGWLAARPPGPAAAGRAGAGRGGPEPRPHEPSRRSRRRPARAAPGAWKLPGSPARGPEARRPPRSSAGRAAPRCPTSERN